MAGPDGTTPWRDLLDEATARFATAGIEDPVTEARWIVAEVVGVGPAELPLVLDEAATVRGVARFDRMLSRRAAAGEPLQYVLGRWGFRSLDLMVDRRVLIPRPETEVVAGLAIDEVTARGADREVLVADLGTGSGAIALSVAVECAAARVLATDASDDALAVARANLAGIGRAATRVTVHGGSWFDALPGALRGCLDVIVSNPPYVADGAELPPVVGEWEPAGALRAGPAGLDDLYHIVDAAPDWLAPSGTLVLEMAPDQTAIIADRCAGHGLVATIHPDLTGRDRAVVARRQPDDTRETR